MTAENPSESDNGNQSGDEPDLSGLPKSQIVVAFRADAERCREIVPQLKVVGLDDPLLPQELHPDPDSCVLVPSKLDPATPTAEAVDVAAVLAAALSYAGLGWPVHPCRRDNKKAEFGGWPAIATIDPETVRIWWPTWGRAPSAIGIVTSRACLIVVDVDGADGAASLQAIENEHGKLACALVAKTPRGHHYYFAAPPDARIQTRVGVCRGIDVRAGWVDADGTPQSSGYVIAPPGPGRYWVDDVDPTKVALTPPQDWLLRILDGRLERDANPKQVANNEAVAKPAARGQKTSQRLKDIHAALLHVEADNRDTWRNVGYAIHHETGGSEQGFELWDRWAATTKSNNYSADDNRTLWQKARTDLGEREPVTIATLFRLAIDNDWQGPLGGWDAVEPNKATSPADVISRWEQEGPLLHLATGIPTLDAQTGGGPTVPCRVYILGAPDAGKTALLVQLLDHFARLGLTVGLLAIDEEDSDVVARLLQRLGWSRRACEERGKEDLARMGEQVGDMPVRFYDATWTIEGAGADLAAFAKERGTTAVLGVDSVQAAHSAAEGGKTSRYDEVTTRVAAIRRVAAEHRLLVIATSEMSRGAYRDPSNKINDMAAGKESGAIEYPARLLLSLKNVPKEQDLIELRIVKSKLGPTTRDDEQGVVLRMDRALQTLTEAFGVAIPTQGDRAAAGAADRDRNLVEDAALLANVVADNPGLGARDVEGRVGAATSGGMGHTRFARARGKLGVALVERAGKGTQRLLYLDGGRLVDDVLTAVPIEVRPRVAAARPPEDMDPGRPEAPRGAPSCPGATGAPALREVPPPPIGGRGTSSGAGRLFPLINEEHGGTSPSLVDPEDDGLPEQPGGRRRP